jgi:hypothetical protein
LNPRNRFAVYTISSRAPSTKLGDFSLLVVEAFHIGTILWVHKDCAGDFLNKLVYFSTNGDQRQLKKPPEKYCFDRQWTAL